MNPTELTMTRAIRLLNEGSLTSKEWVEACFRSINQQNPKLHAFLEVEERAAIQSAIAADAQRTHSGGKSDLPLLGVPIAVKDVLCVEGMRCTCGSKILENYRPPFTATAVRRLQDAGAIVLGKTNTDEFAMGSSTENSAFGPTRNPWNPDRVPGGSSGGSAAAVASGMVPAALGTDTGGSVRQPASFCGVTGLKPSYGRISRYGLVAYGSSLDCVGVLSRTVEDAALLLQAMAGADSADATCIQQPVPDYQMAFTDETSLKGIRVGMPKEYFLSGVQAEVSRAVHAAIEHMVGLGAEVREISLPHTEYALPVYYLIAPAEASANLARYEGVRFGKRVEADNLWDGFDMTRGQGFGAEVKRRIMLGTYALSAGYYDAYYGQAQKVRTLIKQDFDKAFQQVDVIACPVAPHTAFAIGEKKDDPLAMYLEDVFSLPANLAGIPGISLPCGFDAAGLPIGLQLNGPFLGEAILLRVGRAYQHTTPWHLEKPIL